MGKKGKSNSLPRHIHIDLFRVDLCLSTFPYIFYTVTHSYLYVSLDSLTFPLPRDKALFTAWVKRYALSLCSAILVVLFIGMVNIAMFKIRPLISKKLLGGNAVVDLSSTVYLSLCRARDLSPRRQASADSYRQCSIESVLSGSAAAAAAASAAASTMASAHR